MPQAKPSRLGAIVLFISAIAGLLIALYAYFAPLTGVTGTLGALLAIVVCVVIAIMAIILAIMSVGAARIVWRILILLALAGNAFAGVLLHEWWLCIAMAVGFIGLIIDIVNSARTTGAASS